MNDLKAVKIVHDIENRMVYNLYAEFFRFLGIYVGEGSLAAYSAEEEKKDLHCFQIFMYISSRKNLHVYKKNDCIEDDMWIYINPQTYKGLTFEINSLPTLGTKISNVLKLIQRKAQEAQIGFPIQVFEKLKDLFISQNALKAAYNLQYYRMKSDIHEETEQIYKNILDKFQDESFVDISDEKCVRYAKLFCKQKVNLACICQRDKSLQYDINDIYRECQSLLEVYPDFSNVWVLAGMATERSHNNINTAIYAYKKALDMVGNYCYASHVYYWIGSLYEKFQGYHEDAKYAYECAYKHKKKYRNMYKLAKMAEYEGDRSAELFYYNEVLECLRERLTIKSQV